MQHDRGSYQQDRVPRILFSLHGYKQNIKRLAKQDFSGSWYRIKKWLFPRHPHFSKMLYWMLPSPWKQKSNTHMMEGGGLRSGRGEMGETGSILTAPPASHQQIHPKISTFFNMTSTASRSSTVRTLDRRTAERRAGMHKWQPLHHPWRSLHYSPHHPQQSHAGAFYGAGSWFLKS